MTPLPHSEFRIPNCEDAQRALLLNLYGEGDPAAEAALRAHLAECAQCRALAADYAETLAVVRAVDRPAAPAGLAARVAAARPARPALRLLGWVAAAAAAGIVAVAAWPKAGPPVVPERPIAADPGLPGHAEIVETIAGIEGDLDALRPAETTPAAADPTAVAAKDPWTLRVDEVGLDADAAKWKLDGTDSLGLGAKIRSLKEDMDLLAANIGSF